MLMFQIIQNTYLHLLKNNDMKHWAQFHFLYFDMGDWCDLDQVSLFEVTNKKSSHKEIKTFP